jgi:hypothetical protein
MAPDTIDTIEPLTSIPLTNVDNIEPSVKFSPTTKPTHTGPNPNKSRDVESQRRRKRRYPDPYNETRLGRFKEAIKSHMCLILIALLVLLAIVIGVAVFFGARPKKAMFAEMPQR